MKSHLMSLVVAVVEVSAVPGGHRTSLTVEEWVEVEQKVAVMKAVEEEQVFVRGEGVCSVTVVRCAGGDEGDHSGAAETGTESLKQHK